MWLMRMPPVEAAERHAVVAVDRHGPANVIGSVAPPHGQQHAADGLARLERLVVVAVVIDRDRLVAVVAGHLAHSDGARTANQVICAKLV